MPTNKYYWSTSTTTAAAANQINLFQTVSQRLQTIAFKWSESDLFDG